MVEISLRGLLQVASDLIHGIWAEVSFAFTEASEEDWDIYDTVSP